MTFLQILWFILIFVLIIGYFVLDGFDLGIGTLYPFLAKDEKEKPRCAALSVRCGTATRYGC